MSKVPVTPKLNFLVKTKFKTQPISNSMKSVFLFFHIVFALDFGFVNCKSSRLKTIIKFISLTQATAVVVMLGYLFFYVFPERYFAWYFLDVVIYYISAVLLLKHKSTYHDFQFGLHAFDSDIGLDSNSYKVEYKILFAFICIFIYRALLSVSYCTYLVEFCFVHYGALYSYFIGMLGRHIVLIVYMFLYQSVYYRMKKFTAYVKDGNTDIVSCHYLYKNIVEIAENGRKAFDVMMVMALVFNTIDVTLTVYVTFATDDIRLTLPFHPLWKSNVSIKFETKMIKPFTPQVNFLVKSKTETKPLSLITKCLFILFHIVFALDFGFLQTKSRRINIVVKSLALLQILILIAILSYTFFYTNINPTAVWYLFDVLVYSLFGISLLLSKYTYHDFQRDLHAFDTEIEVDSDSYKGLRYVTFFESLFVLVFRIASISFYCTVYEEFCDFPKYAKCAYLVIMGGQNITLLVYALLFQSVYIRMVKFVSFVKNGAADVVACHYLYKHIVEITESAKKQFDVVLVVGLVYVTIDVTLTTYLYFTEDVDKSGNPLHKSLAYVLVVHELVMMFAPAFTAGLVSSQVENLRLVLFDRLVKDQKHTKDIKRFISYIDARPLRFKVWMVVPLDWSLPVIVVNISVTYLIVMIQFTHKN